METGRVDRHLSSRLAPLGSTATSRVDRPVVSSFFDLPVKPVKVTASDNFRTGFKTLSFSQPVYSLFAADEGTNPETAGRIEIENL